MKKKEKHLCLKAYGHNLFVYGICPKCDGVFCFVFFIVGTLQQTKYAATDQRGRKTLKKSI